MPPDALLGPVALLVGALLAVGVLWRDHVRSDADDRAMRDTAITARDDAITGWREQTAATNRLADALEARARADAKRTRRTDV